MQPDSLQTLLLGSFFAIAGLLLIAFRKQLVSRSEDWNNRAPWFLRSSPRGGPLLTIMIVILGALFSYIGVYYLVSFFRAQ